MPLKIGRGGGCVEHYHLLGLVLRMVWLQKYQH